jgi:hypothetical protein
VVLNQTTADASGTSRNVGVFHATYLGMSSQVTLSQVTASSSGGTQNYGFAKNSNYTTDIRDSRIVGDTNTFRNMGGTGIVRVGGSQLSGGPAESDTTCAGVYDEEYIFSANTCP